MIFLGVLNEYEWLVKIKTSKSQLGRSSSISTFKIKLDKM
jgi:hypothetical protein